MASEHTSISHREARALRRIERALARDRVLVRVAGLFPEPVMTRRVRRGDRAARRPALRLAVLAVVLSVSGLVGGVVGALAGLTWLTASAFVVVSAAGALMAWRDSGPTGARRRAPELTARS